MATIAIIDDDIYIGDTLAALLQKNGYDVLRAYSGTEALYLLEHTQPDLLLLDLMLPGLSGEEVLTRIPNIPVIVLSAKADVQNKINLLLSGACDYVTKPFNSGELLARIAAQLRRTTEMPETSLHVGALCLNPAAHSVTANGAPLHLTKTEYAILKLLMQHPEQVLAKSTILERISQDTPDCTESSLKQHISNLRKKLREATGHDYIDAVWGIGFKLSDKPSNKP